MMTQSRFKAASKKIALGLTMAASGFLAPSSAYAYEGDPWFHSWVESYYAAFVSEVDNQFFAINTYMAQLNAYVNSGEGEKGTGIIGTMNKIWSEERPYMENMGTQQSAWARRNMLDGVTAQSVMNKMPDPRNCSEIGNRMAGRGAAGGGGGGRAGRAKIETAAAASAPGTKLNETEHAAGIYTAHGSSTNGYCSKQDVGYDGDSQKAYGATRNAFGCTTIGTMPDADARVQSLFTPAHDYEKVAKKDPAEIAKATSLTYQPAQSDAATNAATNLVSSFSPPALPKNIEDNPAGRMLLTKQKILQSRVSPAITALASISAFREPASLATNDSEGLSSNWTAYATQVYSRIFPTGTVVPPIPSMAELTRFEVYRRMFDMGGNDDSGWTFSLYKDQDAARIAQIQAETQAVQLYVNYEILNRIEENNAIQAAMLAQMVNPVTKSEVEAAASSAIRSK